MPAASPALSTAGTPATQSSQLLVIVLDDNDEMPILLPDDKEDAEDSETELSKSIHLLFYL